MRLAFCPSASRIFIFLACKALYALSDTYNFNQNPLKYLLSIIQPRLSVSTATLKCHQGDLVSEKRCQCFLYVAVYFSVCLNALSVKWSVTSSPWAIQSNNPMFGLLACFFLAGSKTSSHLCNRENVAREPSNFPNATERNRKAERE